MKNLSDCNGKFLGEPFVIVEMGFAPSWPIPWLNEPIHDGIDIFLRKCVIIIVIVCNLEPLGFGQLAAKQLLCQGECVLVAVQGMDAVQQWHHLGEDCAQILQIVVIDGQMEFNISQ